MLWAEDFNPQAIVHSPHSSDACSLAIAANGVAQSLVDRPWFNQSLNKRLTVPYRKLQMLIFLDGAPRCILYACQNEIRHRSPLQGSGMFDQTLLVCGHARFKAFPPDASSRGPLCCFSHFAISVPSAICTANGRKNQDADRFPNTAATLGTTVKQEVRFVQRPVTSLAAIVRSRSCAAGCCTNAQQP